MKKRIMPILLSAVCLMAGCAALPTQEPTMPPATAFWTKGDEAENTRFDEYTTRLFVDEIKDDALTLHYLVRNFEAFGIERPVMDLLSDGHDLTFYETKLAELQSFDYDSLSKVNQITYDALLQDLSATDIDLEYTGSNFFPSSGIQEVLVSNLTEYRFTCAEDVEDYIVCLLQTPALFELCIEDEREIIAAGYGLSDRVYDEVIENCRDIAGDGEESFLVTLSNERIANLPISDTERERLMKKNEEATFDSFLPAYASLADTLESFKGTGVNEGGLAGLGQAGKDYYTYKLQSKLGYTGSVDKLYNLVTKSISTTLSKLRRSAQASRSVYSRWRDWYYYGRGGVAFPEDANEVLDLLEEAAVGRFPTVEGITHTVKDLPKALESTYSNVLAYYTIPPVDDYLSGYITINKSNEGSPAERLTTLAHEGFPGHLLQTVYYSANEPAPIRRLYSSTAYTEGWAVYAQTEVLNGLDLGKNSAKYREFTKLDTDLSYMLYAAMDIAVNYYDWTEEQVEAYLDKSRFSGSMAGDLRDALISMPCVYLDYGMGIYMMNSMRTIAEKARGNDFDAYEFNKLILDIGPCQWDVLEKYVSEYYSI